jgi:hypothetical protein
MPLNPEGGSRTPAPCRGSAGVVLQPGLAKVDDHGAAVLVATQPDPSPLLLIVVVDTVIVGLVAAVVLAALEIATHLLP